ncbi:hypothetical protein Q668_12430 [Alcanivorax sp. PN-3]|nr:hypothetical protein Q668_12430 [Alcanivorax sp. PN-3]
MSMVGAVMLIVVHALIAVRWAGRGAIGRE